MADTLAAPAYASGVAHTPLLGDTIGDNLDSTIAEFGEREALVERATGRRWTYAEFGQDVDRLARGLMARGVQVGERIGLWAPNSAEWTLAQYATAKVGAILVNVNPAYREHELEYVVQQSGMTRLMSAVAHKASNYRAMIEQVRPRCQGLLDVIYLGQESWEELLAAAQGVSPQELHDRQSSLAADDAINIQYTSGTTGFPKGATLSHHNILNNGHSLAQKLNYTPQDRICIPVPFYHTFGMVMGNLAATSIGAAMVIPAPTFEPKATLQAVSEERCTSLYGVPTMFIAELGVLDAAEGASKDPDFDLSSLRTGIMAGSPCPAEIMRRVMSDMNMAEVTIAYGMTETSPVSLMTSPDDDVMHRTETVGQVMPHIEVKIIDPATGRPARMGETGELCTRGYSVMLGYWEQADKTSEAIDTARWMHTGDLAVMDERGYVTVNGRIKDMVIRGGENIYPREIEEFLYTHPSIADVQVIGVPDEQYGEELMAWVVLREGAERVDEQEIRQFSTGKLAHFKIPKYVHVVAEFPMTVTGKVRKVEMRDQARQILASSQ